MAVADDSLTSRSHLIGRPLFRSLLDIALQREESSQTRGQQVPKHDPRCLREQRPTTA